MDDKECYMVEQIHTALLSGSFHEQDVFRLFIILRNQARKGSLVEEFGDFVAHRERDRGLLKASMKSAMSALINKTEVNFPQIKTPEIQSALNETFKLLGLQEIDERLANQITICLISLLQFVKFVPDKNEIQSFTSEFEYKLSVCISHQHIFLYGEGKLPPGHSILVPLLVANNDSYIPSDDDDSMPKKWNELMEIEFKDGFLWDQGFRYT